MSSRWLLMVASITAALAACAPSEGDSCTPSGNNCGSTLTCAACNVPAGSSGVCVHPCTTNADCVGTHNPVGPTPSCNADTCGAHFCGISI